MHSSAIPAAVAGRVDRARVWDDADRLVHRHRVPHAHGPHSEIVIQVHQTLHRHPKALRNSRYSVVPPRRIHPADVDELPAQPGRGLQTEVGVSDRGVCVPQLQPVCLEPRRNRRKGILILNLPPAPLHPHVKAPRRRAQVPGLAPHGRARAAAHARAHADLAVPPALVGRRSPDDETLSVCQRWVVTGRRRAQHACLPRGRRPPPRRPRHEHPGGGAARDQVADVFAVRGHAPLRELNHHVLPHPRRPLPDIQLDGEPAAHVRHIGAVAVRSVDARGQPRSREEVRGGLGLDTHQHALHGAAEEARRLRSVDAQHPVLVLPRARRPPELAAHLPL
mmetsp:Transcript_12291/g.24304  ORF Transcript_12291/g.24304 Transcript_12291/m.24304 type:complete len:336 (-) Transcript_12291:31-1038(-)